MQRKPKIALRPDTEQCRLLPFGRALITCALLVLASCVNEPPSTIVRMLEQSGAGDVRSASTEAVAQWLAKHDHALRETETLCKQVRPNAPANWGNLTEGRVCQAAAQVAFFQFIPREGDHRTFGAGTK